MLMAARLIVYRGEPEQYLTFIAPETYEAVKEYIEFKPVTVNLSVKDHGYCVMSSTYRRQAKV